MEKKTKERKLGVRKVITYLLIALWGALVVLHLVTNVVSQLGQKDHFSIEPSVQADKVETEDEELEIPHGEWDIGQ